MTCQIAKVIMHPCPLRAQRNLTKTQVRAGRTSTVGIANASRPALKVNVYRDGTMLVPDRTKTRRSESVFHCMIVVAESLTKVHAQDQNCRASEAAVQSSINITVRIVAYALSVCLDAPLLRNGDPIVQIKYISEDRAAEQTVHHVCNDDLPNRMCAGLTEKPTVVHSLQLSLRFVYPFVFVLRP
eukprot:SAG31_NODE_1432_length_8373_cov_8.838289_8_plen_185_part_00